MQTGQGLGGAYRDKLGSIYFILPEKDGHKNAELAVQQRSHREGKEAGQGLPLFGLPEAEGSTDRGRARTNGGPCAEEPCGTRQDPLLLSPVHVQVYHPAPDEPSCEPLFKTPGKSTGDERDEPSGVKDGEFIEEVEDLWPQLMPQGEADGLSEAGDQELGKRKSADEGEVKAKRRKVETSEGAVVAEREEVTETEVWEGPEAEGSKEWKKIREQVESKIGPTLEISLVAMNGLVSAIQSGNRQIVRTEKASDRMEKALTETSCMLGKVVAALNGLKKAVEENTREDRRREDRWFDMQRKREEEREREREAERRREDRRRDAEKKERAEIRKLISSIGEKKDSARREEKKNSGKGEKAVGKEKNSGKEEKKGLEEEDGKENQKKEVRSVLGKAYTENTMRDLSQRIWKTAR